MAAVAERARPLFVQVRIAPLSFFALVAAAPLLLGVARLLPAEGTGLVLRLTAAAVCILLVPGALIWRALGGACVIGLGVAGAFAWSMVALFASLALTFAVDGSLWLTLALLGGIAAAALVRAFAAPRPAVSGRGRWAALAVLAGGALFAWAVWWSADVIQGDAIFHLARMRKLEAGDLTSLQAIGEFRHGGLHPGYAFPLWHGAMALVGRLAGVDPAVVVLHGPAVLTPLALLLAYAAGAALFRTSAGGFATAVGQLAVLGFARGGTGSFELLALPGTAARLLFTPALLALVFSFAVRRSLVVLLGIAAAALGLTAVHPTYTFFVALGLAGFLVARLLLVRDRHAVAVRIASALAAVLVPAGLFTAWLWPVVSKTASHDPTAAEQRRAITQYAGQVDVSGSSFHLAPELISRGGAPVVAALLAVPLAVLASRRGWAAFVLGGSLAILAVALIPAAFTTLSDAASLSQARRITAFLPLPFALAGAATVLGRFRLLGCLAGGGVGFLLQQLYPGEFSYQLVKGGPAWIVWVALGLGIAALGLGVFLRRTLFLAPAPWVAAVAIAAAAPTAAYGLSDLRRPAPDPDALTPGLVTALRTYVKPRQVVFGNLEASYRVGAYVPAYVAAAPPAHVADTPANHPYTRVRDVLVFFKTGNLAIPRAYHAGWVLVDRYRSRVDVRLTPVYADSRYELYKVGPARHKHRRR